MDITLTEKQTLFYDALFDDKLKIREDVGYDEFYAFGGFGSGKSRVVASAANLICLNYPGSHGVYIRNTFPELRDSVIPQYLEHNPMNEFHYDYNKSDREISYPGGTRLDFRAFDKDTKILSNEYDFMLFCQLEEIPEELYLASIGRCRRRSGGLPRNITLGEGNPGSGWVKRKMKDNPLPPNVFFVEMNTRDNSENLPIGYEKKLRDNYPDFWVARYVDGEWNSIDEMVFSEFREQRHVVDPINPQYIKHLKQRGGFDYAWRTNSAMNWAFVDFDGNIIIYDEWFMPGATKDVILKEGKRHNYQDNQTGRINKIMFVADYSIKRPDRDGRSLWNDLTTGVDSMNLVEANKDELNNIQLTNMLFKQDRLKITRNCVNTIKEVSNWKWSKVKLGADKDAKDEPVNKDNHHCDNINYIVSNLEGTATVNPQLEAYKKTVEYANIHGRSQYASAGVS